MATMPFFCPEFTAYHEVAHGVVAHLMGGKVEELVLDASDNAQGESRITLRGLLKEQRVRIWFGGPLAESKVRASQHENDIVRFDQEKIDRIVSVGYVRGFLHKKWVKVHFDG